VCRRTAIAALCRYNLSALNIQDMVTTLVDMAHEEETAPGL
jgi:hypothetical protein